MDEKEAVATHGEVREQPVTLIELFYDLVYVYAIAEMTGIFHGTEFEPFAVFRYFVASFAVLQAWMYMTNYVNRFGRMRWYENAAIAANMCAAVFMSNTISADWTCMSPEFNAAMFVILGTVALLYVLRLREGVQRGGWRRSR